MTMKISEGYTKLRPIFNEYFSDSVSGNIDDADAEVLLTHFDLELINNHFAINGTPVPFIIMPCTKHNGTAVVYVIQNGSDCWLAYRSYAAKFKDALIKGKTEIVKCSNIGLESLAALQNLFDTACQYTW